MRSTWIVLKTLEAVVACWVKDYLVILLRSHPAQENFSFTLMLIDLPRYFLIRPKLACPNLRCKVPTSSRFIRYSASPLFWGCSEPAGCSELNLGVVTSVFVLLWIEEVVRHCLQRFNSPPKGIFQMIGGSALLRALSRRQSVWDWFRRIWWEPFLCPYS